MEDFLTACIGTLVLGSLALWYWSYGTLLKKAFGDSKLNALWLLVPLVGFIIPIEWGRRARRLLSGTAEKQPPQWFWPLTLGLYLLWVIPLALFAPWGLLAWAIIEALFSPLYWGTAHLLALACLVPKAYGWLLPLPGMGIAIPIYYGLQAHSQLRISAIPSPDVEGQSQAAGRRWYKQGAFWVSAGAGLIWFFALLGGLTFSDDEETTTASGFNSTAPTVEGIVVDKLTSVPISGATVTCLREGASLQQTTTDAKEYFTISNIPTGARLRVEIQDYESVEIPLPVESGSTPLRLELVKTPKATAETIAKFVLHKAYGDIYPYLEPSLQRQYPKSAYVEALYNRFDSTIRNMAARGDILEDMRIVELTHVSKDEVRVFATAVVRSFRTGHTATLPFTFTLRRAEDGTWRSSWPVPPASR